MKWVVNIVFYILQVGENERTIHNLLTQNIGIQVHRNSSLLSLTQAALMISLIWKFYSDPVTVVPSKWIAPVERLVAFPTGVAGNQAFPVQHSSSPPNTCVPLMELFSLLRWSWNHLLVGSLQQSRHAGSSCCQLENLNLMLTYCSLLQC